MGGTTGGRGLSAVLGVIGAAVLFLSLIAVRPRTAFRDADPAIRGLQGLVVRVAAPAIK